MSTPSVVARTGTHPGGLTLQPAATATSSPPSPTTPTSPSRPAGRLRGLSYLRNYTNTHILSRESHSGSNNQRPSITRATTSPTSPSAAVASQGTTRLLQRSTTDLPTTATATSTPSAGNSDPALSMRSRTATTGGATDMPQRNADADAARPSEASPASASNGAQGMAYQLPSIRFTAHQDPRAQRPSLVFSPMARILPTGKEIIKVGRYSERDNQPTQAANVPSFAPVGFKSKVVSRRHCEFWCTGGRWFIKDVKSSSGTFLNHIRLSSPGTESRPFPVNDGDIVQLGIDFKGGEEMIFRCVKIRVELNKGWQNGPSAFNVQSHKRLRELNNQNRAQEGKAGSSQDCSICLGPIAPCQSLFVAPCSHTWHYKCIRVIINGPHWPHFICPNCRTVADLEADLDEPVAEEEWEQLETAEVDAPVEASTHVALETETHQQQNADASEETYVTPPVALEESDPEPSSHSDGEVVETSDDSDACPRVSEAGAEEAMGYLNIDDAPSPHDSAESNQAEVSNATVAPVDIVRRPVPPPGTGTPRTTRTPSPNGLTVGSEGPMTPRNDAGPFVFDGSAGRILNDQGLASALSQDITPMTPTSL